MVTPVAEVLLEKALGPKSPEEMLLVHKLCRIINVLASVRGYKTVARFLPHEAAQFEPVTGLLLRTHEEVSCSTL